MADELTPAEQQHAELLAKIVYARFPQYWRDRGSDNSDDLLMDAYGSTEQMPSSMNKVFLHLAGEPADEGTKASAKDFLNWMQERTTAKSGAVTQSEFDASPNKQYTLSEGGADNFEALREYNLARSMMEDGEHQAPGTGWDWALSLAGEFLPAERTLSEFRTPKPLAEAMGQNYRDNRAKEALYWWEQGKQDLSVAEKFKRGIPGRGVPDREAGPVWATGALGSKSPQDSPTTTQGMIETLGRADNPLGYYGIATENFRTGPFNKTAHLVGAIANDLSTGGVTPNRPLPQDYGTLIADIASSWRDLPAQQAVASKVTRRTPIVPDDPEKRAAAKKISDVYKESQDFGQEAIRAYSPQLFKTFGAKPRYFTRGEDAIANAAGSFLADPMTLFGLGGGAMKGIPGVAKAAAGMFGPSELFEETLFTGIPLLYGDEPANNKSENVYLNTPTGKKYIGANDKEYKQAYKQGLNDERDRRKVIREGYHLFK